MRSIVFRADGHGTKDRPYSRLDLEVIRNPKLSSLAKAIHTFAVTQPHGWELRPAHLQKQMKEGRGAISKAIRELETAGYLQRYQERECGLRREVIYYWHEKALPESKRTRPDKRALPPLTRIR